MGANPARTRQAIEAEKQRRYQLEEIQPERDPALAWKEVEELARDIDARIEAGVGLKLEDVQRLCVLVLSLRPKEQSP